MQWLKQSLLFEPGQAGIDWMKSHAQVPTPLVMADRLRVFFASRPRPDLSLTSFVDLALDDLRILYIHPEPILELGGPGTFDEHGIMPACALEREGVIYLYYSGWARGHSLPYSNYTGLALSEDGGQTFRKYSPGPILDRTPWEIYSATSPWVLVQDGLWHMWYCAGTHWHQIDGRWEHTYDLKYASSRDGLRWTRTGQAAVPQATAYEAITRPTVLPLKDQYHMWYCYRGSQDFRQGQDSYRIGHAVSRDLQTWRRTDDAAGLSVAPAGWDAGMVAYPAVAQVNGTWIMLYNGSHFGREGFGYATLPM